MLPKSEFIARRNKFLTQMPENSIAIFSAANEVTRSNDTEYPFCQNKHFYYLTGFNEPDALLVLIKTTEQAKENNQAILFSLAKDPLQEVWHGRRIGQEKAVQDYGFDESFILAEANTLIPQYLNGKNQVLYCFSATFDDEKNGLSVQVMQWLNQVKTTERQGGKAPQQIIDCTSMISDMRLVKSEAELQIMRKVNNISGQAHTRAMEKTQADKFEYQIEAEIIHEFSTHGARHVAYNSIVAGGDNANILHYTDNSDVLKTGDLLLIDAGGELAGYAADITRTFPVNGQFSPPQAALYQLVLDAQNLAINAIKPGANFAQLNEITNQFLTEGLVALGILSGDITQLIKDKACKKYFIHGLGHWLGLDVHDVGDYQSNDKKEQLRSFEKGMVMTIEPGLYIPFDDKSVDKKWRGIGIRIEDNIVVTDQGHENLTVTVPKSIANIEKLMQKKD